MHECERIRNLPSEENIEKAWRNLEEQRLEWDEIVWERKQRSIKREIKRNEGWIARGSLNRLVVNLDRWRRREVSRHLSRKVSRKWSSTVEGINEVSRNKPTDTRTEARSIHQVSRSYRGGRSILDRSIRCRDAIEDTEYSRSIHQVSRSCWDYDKKRLKKLDRQQGIEEVSS